MSSTKPVSARRQAIAAGKPYYVSAQPCSKGHLGTRYTKNGTCCECQLNASQKWKTPRKAELSAKVVARTTARYRTDPAYREMLKTRVKTNWRAVNGLPEPTRPAPVVCECCGRAPYNSNLVLDHDHQTGAFRGWLCNQCNLGLGQIGDTLDSVERLRAYLLRAELV
jgi:hypothetical protein